NRYVTSVELDDAILVLLERCAFKSDPSKDPMCPRIGKNLRISPILEGNLTTSRPWNTCDLRADFEFLQKECLEGISVQNNKDYVHALAADLKSNAAAADADRPRRTPFFRGAASRESLSMPTANS